MQIRPFKLERYFAEYEFRIQYLLSPSDCESITLPELLGMADEDSLTRWQNLSLGYTESAGHPVLRAEIAKLYTSISADNLVVAAPEEAIFIAMNTLLRPGDHVIAISPAYQSLYEVAHAIGCTVTPWPVTLQGNHWTLDVNQLETLITPATRLLVINFPHNPTGYLPTEGELRSIVAIARRHQLRVFSDEMYRWLEYDPTQQLPALCDLYEQGISLAGLSKAFALPGLRIGWLATQDAALAQAFLAFKDYTTICNSAPSEILGLMALRNRNAIWARNLQIVQHNLTVAEHFFARHQARFLWPRPNAGSTAFPRWLGQGSVADFCQAVLTQQGVMIVPDTMFDQANHHFRIGLGRRNFGEALAKVEQYLGG
ncbi:MAG: aminotransferase class I/II-fold pyridoxal phosphate-dependent enzyme [Caldilineaceae bacterium]